MGYAAHVPFVVLTVCPTFSVPLITGRAVLTGAPVTRAVATDLARAVPFAFVAAIWTRIVDPASTATST